MRPETGADVRDGRFEARMQIFVVGAERGVGDLDARLLVGRHREDPR
jgi:hypothetical protein